MLSTIAAPPSSRVVRPRAALNFLLTGVIRSGLNVLQSVIDQSVDAVCHRDLLYEESDPKTNEQVRRQAYESYFGPCSNPKKYPEWMIEGLTNPCRYLAEQVFDRPMNEERVVGVKVLYQTLDRFDLYDFLDEREREGDFGIILVTRNPVACFVSYLQAKRFGVWRESLLDRAAAPPPPVAVRVEELVPFVRAYEVITQRIKSSCQDLLEVPYAELYYRRDQQVQRVFQWLELPQQDLPRPAIRRLRNNRWRERISNWDSLHRDVPFDIRGYLDNNLV